MKRKLNEKWLKPYSEWTPEMRKEYSLPKPAIMIFKAEDVDKSIEEILIEEIEKEEGE